MATNKVTDNSVVLSVMTDGLFEELKSQGHILEDCGGLGLYACKGIVLFYPSPSHHRRGVAKIMVDTELYSNLERCLFDFELPFPI